MSRKKINYKVGESMAFRFAGTIESGSVVSISGKNNDLRYRVFDGTYTYPVSKEQII
jgi:hypothetical protein